MIEQLKNRNYLKKMWLFIFPFLFYFFNIRKIIFPINFQQDDVRELNVANFLDFSCIISSGDNHPLWTYLIWAISKITFLNLGNFVSILNVLLCISSLYLIYKYFYELYNSKVALLVSIIFISSPSLLTYSISLKQYMLELFYSCYCLYISKELTILKAKLNSSRFYLISIFFVLGSLVNIVIFCLIIFYYFLRTKFKITTMKRVLLFSLPLVMYLNRAVDKITRESYGSYWDNFFISSHDGITLLTKILFIFNMMFKSLFGYYYIDQFVYLLLGILILSFLFKLEANLFSKLVVFTFLFLNIFKLYPLGAGRTDLIIFPFILIFFGDLINYLLSKFNKTYANIIILLIVVAGFINIDPYYKQEQVDLALTRIKENYSNDTALVISSEQYPSFLHYGQEFYGQKIVKKGECRFSEVDFENYFVLGKYSTNPGDFEKKLQTINQFSKVFVLGIELDDRGVFRDTEEYLYSSNYKKTKSFFYKDGINLIFYSK